MIYSRSGGRNAQTDTIVDANQADITPHLANLQLYNLTVDVGETTNLLGTDGISSSERAKVSELHGLMYGYLSSGRSVP